MTDDAAINALWQKTRQQRHDPEALHCLLKALQEREDPTAALLQAFLEQTVPPHTEAVALKPCRILLITNLYPPQTLGGYGLLMADFARILEERGHTLHILTTDTPYLGKAPPLEDNITRNLNVFGRWENGVTVPLPEKEAQAIALNNLENVKKTIEIFQPKLCLAGDIEGLSSLIFRPLLQQAIPTIHHLGHKQPGYVIDDTPTSPFYRLVTASGWLKNVIEKLKFPLQKIDVVYSAGDVQKFHHPILPCFKKLNIVFAGIMQPYKGPQTLLQALYYLHQKKIDFTCTFAGDSTDAAFLERFQQGVHDAGLDEKVRLVGKLNREELRQLYFQCNVLVFPSLVDETFGMSQVEAMAAGLVVISTGTGGADEIIEQDVTGLKFPKEDANTLASYCYVLSRDSNRCERLAKAGQEAALTRFNVRESTYKIERIFNKMIATKNHTIN